MHHCYSGDKMKCLNLSFCLKMLYTQMLAGFLFLVFGFFFFLLLKIQGGTLRGI